ncbi:MAG TPA: MraY family glycosyltransferase [Thermomicrobiaceae bacterium]|nr:MraY family glycosyltransferase [Thermomicrobiaceae bacterium]
MPHQFIKFFVLVFVVALGASLLLVPLARALGRRLGFIDQPRPGEVQRRPIARTGGYAILAAFALALLVTLPGFPRFPSEYHHLLGFGLGALAIVPLALLDDWRRLGPLPQFFGQIVVAAIAMSFGVLITNVANPFGGLISFPLALAIPITLFWYLGMINTLNFLDTMDGLTAGVTLIAAGALFLRTLDLGQYSIALLPLALVGVCLGFLPYNLPPARVFMGTSGSMFLGYALATLAIIGGAKVGTTLMVLGVPIVDTALVIAQRTLAGRSPFQGGDGAHLPHRMLAIGLRQPRVVLSLYTLTLVLAYLAWSLHGVVKLYALGATVLALAAILAVIAYRAQVGHKPL